MGTGEGQHLVTRTHASSRVAGTRARRASCHDHGSFAVGRLGLAPPRGLRHACTRGAATTQNSTVSKYSRVRAQSQYTVEFRSGVSESPLFYYCAAQQYNLRSCTTDGGWNTRGGNGRPNRPPETTRDIAVQPAMANQRELQRSVCSRRPLRSVRKWAVPPHQITSSLNRLRGSQFSGSSTRVKSRRGCDQMNDWSTHFSGGSTGGSAS